MTREITYSFCPFNLGKNLNTTLHFEWIIHPAVPVPVYQKTKNEPVPLCNIGVYVGPNR